MKETIKKKKVMIEQEQECKVYISNDGIEWINKHKALERNEFLQFSNKCKVKNVELFGETSTLAYFESEQELVNYINMLQYRYTKYIYVKEYPTWVLIHADESGDRWSVTVTDAKEEIEQSEKEIAEIRKQMNE